MAECFVNARWIYVWSGVRMSERNLAGGASLMKASRLAAIFVGFILTAGTVHAQATPSLNLEGTGMVGPGPAACAPARCSGQFSATLSGQLSQAVTQAPLQMNLNLEPPFPCICGAGASILCPAVIPCVAQASDPAKAAAKKPGLQAQVLALQQQMQSLQQQLDALTTGIIAFPIAPGCRPATGDGTFVGGTQNYSVNFTGQICSDDASNVALSGTIAIVQSPLETEVTWAAGTLVASGPVHIPAAVGNPLPISGPMVVSIVGAVAEIPALTP
jgi:hypothetical protein